MRKETGKTIVLSLEPEPLTTLETCAEAVAFFEQHVFGGAARQTVEDTGVSRNVAEQIVRRHLGLCFDTCHQAVEFEDIVVTNDPSRLAEMQERSGNRTVPQIFIGDTPIGGFDELYALDKSGELDKMLAS